LEIQPVRKDSDVDHPGYVDKIIHLRAVEIFEKQKKYVISIN